jgi:TPP-dependent pyruvate/acetoin dehydrogenase alpha subunit
MKMGTELSDRYSKSVDLDQEILITSGSQEFLIEQLKLMIRIRLTEKIIADMRQTSEIGGPVHLSAGQEAIAVGISQFLRKSDRIFSGHRSHAHILATGSDPYRLFAEVLGRSTGLTKGMGGSMHLWDGHNGFFGAVPIVAGTVPLAVGAALALKLQKKGDIAVVYFGDGAVEEGVVHESLNLARQLKVPILFVCENNQFSSHMHISQRQPTNSVARFSIANEIPTEIVDGNNILNVASAANKLINLARNTSMPGFIEAITYRHYGHVDWRKDTDVGINRSPEDLIFWKKRDPIVRLETSLIKQGFVTNKDLEDFQNKINFEIKSAWNRATKDPTPVLKSLFEFVYKK